MKRNILPQLTHKFLQRTDLAIIYLFVIGLFIADISQCLVLITRYSCQNNTQIVLDDKILQNNVWNKNSGISFQCVFAPIFNTNVIWVWDGMNAEDHSVKSTANLLYGFLPWGLYSTTPKLPIAMNALHTLTSHYDFFSSGDGEYNTAFRIYLTNSKTSHPKHINSLVEIWLTSNEKPNGQHVGDMNIDDQEYELWTGSEQNGWPRIILKAKKFSTSGTLHIEQFLATLLKRGRISPDLYVACIRFGDEIISGKGLTIVRRFDVDVR